MEEQNFWQTLSDTWKTSGQNFLTALPKFIFEGGLNLGSNWLAGLLENGLDFNSYRKKAYYQYQLSEKMAQNAYNRQLDFWNKQNAYNTPSAMVGRMVDAGLNPAQSISPQPAGNLSSVSTPMPSASSSRPNIIGGLETFGEIIKSVKELGLLDKQTELKAKELISKQLDIDLQKLAKAAGFSDNMIKEMDRRAQWESIYGNDVPVPDNPYLDEFFPEHTFRNSYEQQYREGESRISLIDAEIIESNANAALAIVRADNYTREVDARIRNLDANSRQALSQAQLNDTNYVRNMTEQSLLDIAATASKIVGFDVRILPESSGIDVIRQVNKLLNGQISVDEMDDRVYEIIMNCKIAENAIVITNTSSSTGQGGADILWGALGASGSRQKSKSTQNIKNEPKNYR